MTDALKLADSARSLLYSQSNTWRWPGRHTIGKQNIAEHHSIVTQLVLLIIDEYEIPEEYQMKAIRRAITHDLPEAFTNDIPFVIKRDYPDFAQAYDIVEDKIIEAFPQALQNKVPKDSIPWLVVKLADAIDVYLFTGAEIDLGNNNGEILEIYTQSKDRIHKIETSLVLSLWEAK